MDVHCACNSLLCKLAENDPIEAKLAYLKPALETVIFLTYRKMKKGIEFINHVQNLLNHVSSL